MFDIHAIAGKISFADIPAERFSMAVLPRVMYAEALARAAGCACSDDAGVIAVRIAARRDGVAQLVEDELQSPRFWDAQRRLRIR